MRSIYQETYEEGIPYTENPYQCSKGGYRELPRPFLGLRGPGQEMSQEALLEGLPSRPMSDGLVTRFFENDDPSIPVTCEYFRLHRLILTTKIQKISCIVRLLWRR